MIAYKQFQLTKIAVGPPTDSEYELIRKQMLAPNDYDKDKITVFNPYGANNIVDRDNERFSYPILKNFTDTAIGKPILKDHWGADRDGKIFDSSLVKFDVNDALELIGKTREKNLKDHLKLIEEIDNGIYFCTIKYYMVDISEEMRIAIDKIKIGVDGFTSIGFYCPAIATYKNDKSEILWWEYANTKDSNSETREFSRVYLGSQYGAQHGKAANNKSDFDKSKLSDAGINNWLFLDSIKDVEIKKLCKGLDEIIFDGGNFIRFSKTKDGGFTFCEGKKLIGTSFTYNKGELNLAKLRELLTTFEGKTLKEKQVLIKPYQKYIKNLGLDKDISFLKRSSNMKVILNSIGFTKEYDEDDFTSLLPEIDLAVKTHIEDAEKKNEKLENELKKYKVIFGDEFDEKALKELQAVNEQYVKDLQDEYIKYSIETGTIKEEDEEAVRDSLKLFNIEQLKDWVARAKKSYDEKFPAKPQVPTEDEDIEKDNKEDTKKKVIRKNQSIL